jgi:diguanylate cyclase (GGDEF)-like protein
MEKVASIKTANMATKRAPSAPQEPVSDLPLSERGQLKLHQRLLGTLEIGTLINRFFGWLSEQQQITGIEYIHPVENITLAAGSPKKHKAKYMLRLEQHYFGEIIITSQKRFSEQDLLTHEQSLGIVIHYLKNAIDHQSLEKIAFHDALTGVMNRTALEELLPKEAERAQRYNFDLSVMMIDIDHFKTINDCIGHMGGDEILRHVSTAIKSQLRKSDMPFRYGGDEFLLILPNTDLVGAHQAATRIMASLNKEVAEIPNCPVSPKLSIGIAAYQQGESHEDLLRRVDNALYDSKNNGRNCIS